MDDYELKDELMDAESLAKFIFNNENVLEITIRALTPESEDTLTIDCYTIRRVQCELNGKFVNDVAKEYRKINRDGSN